MITIAFFNNKGGVGKTSLVYHLGWMLSELGIRTIAADLDPQGNLTSMSLRDDDLELLFEGEHKSTIFSSVAPLKRGVGDVKELVPIKITPYLSLLPGDLELSDFEDDLSLQWPKCVDRDERAFRVITAFSRLINMAGDAHKADIGLIDVGPNFGAINRAALIASDYVVIPVAPDLFSVQGLGNVGRKLKFWRAEWQDRIDRAPVLDFMLPQGKMRPIGYVVSRHSLFAGGAVKAFQRWLDRIPLAYRENVESGVDFVDAEADPFRLGRLKDYRSLIAMAQEARKPMFRLKPADGAIGGHQGAVASCYADYKVLASTILEKVGYAQRR